MVTAIIAIIAVFGIAMLSASALADASLNSLQDNSLISTLALPATATTATSPALDTGAATGQAYQPGNVDWLLTPPALNATQLPNTATMTYSIIMSPNPDMSSPVTLYPSVAIQTGAGGVGAAAPTPYRFRIPSNALRYIGFTATGVGNGNCSGVNATLQPLF